MIQKIKPVFSSNILRNKWVISGVSFLLLLIVTAFASYEFTKLSVTLNMDGEEQIVFTHEATVEGLLQEQEVDVTSRDEVIPSLDTKLEDDMVVTYKPANLVIFTKNGETGTVWTTAETVSDLLHEKEIKVSEYDRIEPSLRAPISERTSVVYEESFPVTINVDGDEEEVWTIPTNVANLLDRENITLNDDDFVEPKKEEEITSEMDINVVRVETKEEIVEESKNYATVTRNDDSLPSGEERVIEAGTEGKLEKHYEVTYENGEEVSRELIEEMTISEPEDRIVAVGTRQPSSGVSRSSSGTSGNAGEWRTFTSTAYTAYCTGCSGVTATGIDLRSNPNQNVIAVDPNVIPLGSRVEIEGKGVYLAADTGGAIQGEKIDIFKPDGAHSYGRQSVRIRILE
ncbi:G5 and 3D domain-containing protein [Texcoconibacillus texcoconensis]|uniref:Uncharacterized protein YabE (DUF348 family) n=1 Tax=Texcoconibacillus texcoconensis TaxID=1095777 RepID=A0A840QUI6_9BACI|nr:G5 and 3D domain-containing protein [Texcoconibacillus texcoconensis]MBB5174917.1 uncharacterized protein YabE (DUF348 family) [Texcoconibacillus texcoconensis]